MLTLTRMRMVSAIVKHGTMREAAEALTYSAPALSQQISRLERDLGVALFERAPRGVVPTVAGRRLAEIADHVVGLVDAATVEMQDHADRIAGVLRIGSFPSGSATIVPPAIKRFLKSHPRAEIGLREAEPDDLIELLKTGLIDVALVYGYELAPRAVPGEVHEHHVVDDPIHVLSPTQGPSSRDLRDLVDQKWISTEVGTAGAQNLEVLCARHGFSPVVRYRSNDYDVIQALVAAGLGVALVPELALRPSRAIEVLPIRPTPPPRVIKTLVRVSDPNPLIEPLIAALMTSVTGNDSQIRHAASRSRRRPAAAA